MSDPEVQPCPPAFGLPHAQSLLPVLAGDLPTWFPTPDLLDWHRPERIALLFQRVMAVVRQPIEAVVHRGWPAWRITGLCLIRQVPDGQIAGELWMPRGGQMQLVPIPADRLAVHPCPLGLRWLNAIVDAHALEFAAQVRHELGDDREGVHEDIEDADDGLHDYLDQLRTWLARQLRRHADLRAMPSRVAQALELDPDTLRLARHTVCDVDASDAQVTVAAWNLAVANRAQLRQVRAEAPQLLPLYGAMLADAMLPRHAPEDAVSVLKRTLARHEIRPAMWRLIHRSPARLALSVRQAYRGSRAKAMLDFFRTLQDFNLREPPEPEVLHACWAQEGNDQHRWATFEREISPQAICYGHVARLYGRIKAQTSTVDRAQLRVDLEQVVRWIDTDSRTNFSKTERRAGWPWLVRQAEQAVIRQRAEASLIETWEVPAPFQIGDLHFVPLGGSLALWEEGVAMRHCVFDRRANCESGWTIVVSIQRHVQEGRPAARVATAQYDQVGSGWVLKSVLGPANRVPPGAVQRAAQTALTWIAGVEPTGRDGVEDWQTEQIDSSDDDTISTDGEYDCGVEGCCRPDWPYSHLRLFSDMLMKHRDVRSDPRCDHEGLPCEGYLRDRMVTLRKTTALQQGVDPQPGAITDSVIWFVCEDGTLAMEGVETEYEQPEQDGDNEEDADGWSRRAICDEPTWSGQIAAMRWFEDLSPTQRRELGVRIVDGEMPGSSYSAVELRGDVVAANETAQRLGLACRFKAHRDGGS